MNCAPPSHQRGTLVDASPSASAEATEDGDNYYGAFLRVEGELVGPQGSLSVVLIWIRWHVDGSLHFVTLKPRTERKP